MGSNGFFSRGSLAPRSTALLATTALTATLTLGAMPAAGQLAWDGTDTGTTPGADGGAGTWSAGPSTNWVDTNGANVSWVNGEDAVFGEFSGASSGVNVVGTVEAGSLTFNRTNYPVYAVYGGTVVGVGVGGTELFTSGSLDFSTNLAGGDWIKTGTGSIRFLSANSYTGVTYINEGSLAISNANALGTADGGTVVASGAALVLNGSFTVANEALTIAGNGFGSGALTNNFSNSVYGGSVTLSDDATVGASGNGQSLTLTGPVATAGHTLTFNVWANANGAISGVVSGLGDLTKAGVGTLTLSGINTYTGDTTITGGTLRMGAQNIITSSAGVHVNNGTWDLASYDQTVSGLDGNSTANVTLGSATLTVDNAVNSTYGGGISGAGGLTKAGNAIFDLGGINTYTGDTKISGGTLRMGAENALASSAGVQVDAGTWDLAGYDQTVNGLVGNSGTNVTLGSATLTVDNAANNTYWGEISGAGGLTKTGSGIFDLRGVNTYLGSTNVAGGTMRVGPGAAIQNSSSINISNGASLDVDSTNALSQTVAVDLTGAGSQFAASFDQQIGSLAGEAGTNVWLNPGVVLTTGTSNTSTVFSGNLGNGGTGALTKIGTGSFTLNGTNSYTGATTVRGGTLLVNGSIAASSLTTVEAGATLGGNGTVGTTTVQSSGTLAAGNSIDTLNVDGNLTLEQGSHVAYEAGAPGADLSTPGTADSVSIDGDLALEGATLDVTDVGGFGPGLYRVFDYTGTLTMANGGLLFGQTPAGTPLTLQILAGDKQINLINSGNQTLQFWNANGAADATHAGGGSGTWSNTSPVWTDENGAVTGPMQPQPGFAIFGGEAGTVAVDDAAGSVETTGLQFVSDGYHLTGDTLTLVADVDHPAPVEIRVGDGSAASASYVATIDNVIAGSDGLNKTGDGTLVLSNSNTYSGGTTLSAGTLSVSSDANLGEVNGGLTFDGGALQFGSSFDLATSRAITLAAGGGTIDTDGFNTTVRRDITGSGDLTKAGAGTLTLEGMNTYTGKTTIDAGGTLALAGQGRINASSGVEVNGALDISAAASAQIKSLTGSGSVGVGSNYLGITAASGTFSGVIAGDGGLMVNGGTQILTGGNTFLGTLGISEGAQVRVGDGGTSGSIVGDVNNWGSLVFDRSDGVTYAGTITGPAGMLGVTGGGTLTLTGENSFSGGTVVDDATLAVGNGGTGGRLGYGDTMLVGNAALVFNRSDSYTYGGAIIGAGDLEQAGSGTTVLAGDLSGFTGQTTVSAGTLRLESLPGGDIDIQNLATADFASVADVFYDGSITGNGLLLKSEDSTLTLTGDNTGFAGTTRVDAGALVIKGAFGGGFNVESGGILMADGTMSGALNVKSGGLLGGTGTLGSLTIEAGGIHAPGHSPGTQTINGAYVNHGTFLVDVTPDTSDRLIVNGSVDITGATLALIFSPTTAEDWNPLNGPYTLIANDGADQVTGTFASVTKNLVFLDETLDYAGGDGNDLTLQLERNDVGFADVAETLNQRATAGAIASLPTGNAVWNAISLQADDASARAAFDALSGEMHASVKSALIEDSHFLREAANERLRSAFGGVGAAQAPVLAFGEGGPNLTSAPTDRFAAWGHALGSWGSFDGNGNAAALDTSTGGLITGFDASLGDHSRLGIVAGYSDLSMHANGRGSSASSENWHLGLYGGTQWDNFALRAGAAYTWSDVDTRRVITVPGVAGSYEGGYDAGTFQVFGELGYRIDTAVAAFEPFVNLAYVNLHTDEFSESGGAAALSANGQSTDTTFTTIGLRTSSDFALGDVNATARGMIGWRHAYDNSASTAALSFAGSDSFSVTGVPIGKNAAVVEAGLDFDITPNVTLGVAYQGQFSSGAIENGFNTKLNVMF